MKILLSNMITYLCLGIIGISFFSLYQSMKDPDKILTILGYRPAVIVSGSMKPILNPGDMIISKVIEPEEVKIGYIITYRVERTIPNTHRVVSVVHTDGKLGFETKGDANEAKDSNLVTEDKLLGEMVLNVPYIGRVTMFLKTKLGFTLFIIVPLVITAIFELYQLFIKS